MISEKKIGLALSGGGYRAAAFHLGTIKKLHQLKLLDKVDVISTISGGSIAGAFFLLSYNGNMEEYEKLLKEKLKTSTLRKIILNPYLIFTFLVFLSIPIIVYLFLKSWLAVFLSVAVEVIIAIIFQFHLFPLTKYKIRAYEKIFFGKAVLSDLPNKPKLAINASNLETGTLFTFSKDKMSDSSYEYPKDGKAPILFKHSCFPIANAVASSTSVPFIFNPVHIEKKYFKDATVSKKRANPSLVDGGVYDNQGIHKIRQPGSSYKCDIIVCSDGSMPFKFEFTGFNSFMVLARSTDLMMRKIKSLQFIRDVYEANHEIAYFSLDWKYERVFDEFVNGLKNQKIDTELLDYYKLPAEWIGTRDIIEQNRNNIKDFLKKMIRYDAIPEKALTEKEVSEINEISTNLTALSDKQIELLARHAGRLTEIHIKLFCPSLNKSNEV